MSGQSAQLAAYLPRYHLERLTLRAALPRTFSCDVGSAAALFVDISGFTQVTDRISSQGPAGVEALSHALNEYFGRLTDIIADAGGDVVFFAGDAALAVWPVATEQLADATAAACSAALRICHDLFDFTPSEGISLQQRASVGAGAIRFAEVGGVNDRWLAVVSGDAIEQAVTGCAGIEPRMTALSEPGAALCRDSVEVEPLAQGFVRVRRVYDAQRFTGRRAAQPDVTQIDHLVRAYVPEAVLSRVAAGHTEWLADFRQVTIAFIGLGIADGADSTESLDAAVESIQTTLSQFDGSVYQLVVDDKGTTLIAAFGLPPFSQEQAAGRAIEAVRLIAEHMQNKGVGTSIGVATGRSFCGPYGPYYRRQYTVVGPVINLAARLMQAADGAVLCDVVTRQRAGPSFRFGASRALQVKGRPEPVMVAAPLGRLSADTRPGMDSSRERALTELVGRDEVRNDMSRALAAISKTARSTIVITGEAGIGKSMLLADTAERAATIGVRVMRGAGDAIERSTAYYAFQPVLRELLRDQGARPGAGSTPAESLVALLHDEPRLALWAPLMSAIIPLDLPHNATTRAMPGEARAEAVKTIALHLLDRAAQASPMVLMIDDLQWLDSNSLELLSEASHQLNNVLLVLGTRPPDDGSPVRLKRMVDSVATQRIDLQLLPAAAVASIAARKLGATSLPDAVSRLIVERSEGHPFYAEELALTLRESGVLETEGGEVRMTCTEAELSEIELPSSIQGVITSRIDRLDPTGQLAVKTASVVGRVFGFDLLSAVYPLPADRPLLRHGMDLLQKADLTVIERPDPDLAWLFKHIITQEVAYEGLPFAQRRELHRSIGTWYESKDAVSPTQSALLAHHWDRAGDAAKALHYCELAGEAAVTAFANREAILFLNRAREIADANPDLADSARRARWERLLGDANIKLSDYSAARTHMAAALTLLGDPMPRTSSALTIDLLRQIMRQMKHRRADVAYRRDVRQSGVDAAQYDDARGREIAAAYKRLGEVAWFNDEKLPLLHATFKALNHAEVSGADAEVVNGYGSVAVVASFANLKGIAENYVKRCIALGEATDNPSHRGRSDLLVGLYAVQMGDWTRAEKHADRGTALFASLGDRFRWESMRSMRGYVHLCRGEMEQANQCWSDVLQSAQNGALQSRVFAACGALATALQSNDESIASRIPAVETLIAQKPQAGDLVYCHGVAAAAHSRAGNADAAMRHADAALELIGGTPPSTYYTLWGIAGVAEACITLASQDRGTAARKRAGRAANALTKFSRMIPIGRPLSAYWNGVRAHAEGRNAASSKYWKAGLADAETMRMPVERDILKHRLSHTLQ